MSMIVSDVSTGAEPTITMSRTYAAPRELVWACITEPRHMEQWWGPRRYATRVDQSDLRPGGAWRVVQTGKTGRSSPSAASTSRLFRRSGW